MRRLFAIILSLFVMPAIAAESDALNSALQSVRSDCDGISTQLSGLKTMAGINTAVTGVGTAAGAGAVVTGVMKSKVDGKINSMRFVIADRTEMEEQARALFAELDAAAEKESTSTDTESLAQLEKKSKTLGDARTGLLATSTATSIAGAVIAGTNRVQDDLQAKINKCMASVNRLNSVYMQERMMPNVDAAQVARAERIMSECGAWGTADVSVINKHATGAAVSSGIGAGVGLAGTVTSAMANTDKVRSATDDKGIEKEENLNKASNILAGGATVASAAATIFNASQINAVKKIVEIADKCEGALKK